VDDERDPAPDDIIGATIERAASILGVSVQKVATWERIGLVAPRAPGRRRTRRRRCHGGRRGCDQSPGSTMARPALLAVAVRRTGQLCRPCPGARSCRAACECREPEHYGRRLHCEGRSTVRDQ
jgi:hypothetical protein